MGARGPLRNSTSVRTLRGEYPPSVTPADGTGDELKPTPGMEPEVRREYRRLQRLLSEPPTVISKRDHTALADLALSIVRLRQAEGELSKHGLILTTDRGPIRNPASLTAKEYRQSVQFWSAKFGLSPDARARMNLPPVNEADEDPFGLLD